jgi:hypothetical protein
VTTHSKVCIGAVVFAALFLTMLGLAADRFQF